MNAPSTKAGQWLLDRSQWEGGLRAFRVRINATAGPDDMHRHILAIEAEARADVLARVRERVAGLLDSPAAYPAAMGPTIRAENDVVRAILAILEEET